MRAKDGNGLVSDVREGVMLEGGGDSWALFDPLTVEDSLGGSAIMKRLQWEGHKKIRARS